MPVRIKKLNQKKKMPLPKSKPRHANPKHPMNTEKTKSMAEGGKLKMVEKGGKKVPFFAADGKGKMAMGGMMKKKGYAKGGAVKVKSGDTLSQIAKKNGVTLKALLGANPSIKNANKIRLGQSIKLPAYARGKRMAGATSSNPYAGIKRGQMADMDVKNKSEKRQRTATRSMQSQVKQGGSRMTPTPSKAAATKESKSGREAMLAKARKLRDSKKASPDTNVSPNQVGVGAGVPYMNKAASLKNVTSRKNRKLDDYREKMRRKVDRKAGGGMMKKKGYAKGGMMKKGMAKGGVMRGTGAATKGKRFGRSG
jgi:LysM repeat protein